MKRLQKKHLHLTMFLALAALSQAACSTKAKINLPQEGAQQGTPPQSENVAPDAPRTSMLEGTWAFECSHRLSSEITFRGSEFASRTTLFSDDACTTPLKVDERKGDFSLGQAAEGTGYMPFDTEWTDSSGNPQKRYDIVQVRGEGELRFGKQPGKTAEKRPTEILESPAYLKK